jgi:hypothetical protein
MLTDRPLQIEVLVNSPGPHDQVRIREPFGALQQLGVDCRIHERPFRFSSCIRPHSLVIWQRPLPESRQRQWEHLQWLRERGCLLFTEWDDHPDLFPALIRAPLEAMALAPLDLCHGLHTSSARLAQELGATQPLGLVLENQVASIPPLDLGKHQRAPLRVLVANQNRGAEHQTISPALVDWARACQQLQVVVLADRQLAQQIPAAQLEFHPLLDYAQYRAVLRSCQIALLPLAPGVANGCKTPIKLLECGAESVAVVCGPELYGRFAPPGVAAVAPNLEAVVAMARGLAGDLQQRLRQVRQAHAWVTDQWQLAPAISMRLWLYQQVWRRRKQLDQRLVERIDRDPTVPDLHHSDFGNQIPQS